MAAHHRHRLLQPPDVRRRGDAVAGQDAGRQGARVRLCCDQRHGRVVRRRQPPPLAGPWEHGHGGGPRELRGAGVSGGDNVLPHDGEPAGLDDRVGEVVVREHHDERHADVPFRQHQHQRRRDGEPDDRRARRGRRHRPRRRPVLLGAGAPELPAFVGLRSGPGNRHARVGGDDGSRRPVVVGAHVPVVAQHAAEQRRRGVRQTYRYEATDGCYLRNVTSSGYSIVSDQSSEACVKGPLR
ncbi:hypothetical protein VPH35_109953 [Triticum aestivum]